MATKEKTVHKKELSGIIIKLIDDKTVKIEVEKKKAHPLYGKIIKSHKKFVVDKAGLDVKLGDKVVIRECRPLSKNKTFKLINIA